MQPLGWIGLGHMGSPMAMNLLKAGQRVNVYNRSPEKAEELVKAGASRLNSPKEIVDTSDIVFLMLSDAAAVRTVLTQEGGVLEGIRPGKIIVDMSTIAPEDSKTFAGLVAEKGGAFLDAPVSGSVGAAQSSQLLILVGGEKAILEKCQPYLGIIGKETIHFGPHGMGSSAKLTINLLLGIVGQGLGETVLFGEKMGLEKAKVLHMISQSALNTPLFQLKKNMYLKEEFPAAFMVELISKDLGLIKAEADQMHGHFPLAEAANTTYRQAKENGKAKLDMAAVYQELKEQNR